MERIHLVLADLRFLDRQQPFVGVDHLRLWFVRQLALVSMVALTIFDLVVDRQLHDSPQVWAHLTTQLDS